MISVVDVIGLSAFVLNVIGHVLLVRKSTWGWWVRIPSILLWLGYSISIGSLPMVVNFITFFCLTCWGIIKWKREARRLKEHT